MGAGIVSRDGRPVLFVVHGETGRAADIGVKAEPSAYRFTWATHEGDRHPIGTSEHLTEIAATIVRSLGPPGLR
ncbi:hypothetical protein [Actinocorallia sp. A-T 12471]|uniref:hypothetical protein n=1 Tax=Actinocorallia sp. A-T 12471 TaxID=3089813 RepID=UPI0029CC27D0|nr:hypothetical protein [Actinocorallia sp. A-T 12471]MDX6738345.1 hypothetical protein [Actinocorallia sp. A-T 12471]